jgi:hypothetical protein
VPIVSPLFSEVIQASIPTTHEEENMVIYTPFQICYVVSFNYLKIEEVLYEHLYFLDPSCHDKGDYVIENIDHLYMLRDVMIHK